MITLILGLALGQEGFDAHAFRVADMSADSAAPLTVPSVGDGSAGHAWGGALVEFADRSWVTRDAEGADTVRLDDLYLLDMAAGWRPHDRVTLGAQLPVALASRDADGTPRGAAPGDLRLAVQGALLHTDRGAVGVAGRLGLPTGDSARLLGQSGFSGELLATSRLQAGPVRLSAAIGPAFRPNTSPDERPAVTRGGDAIVGLGAVGLAVHQRAAVNLEARLESYVDPEVLAAMGTPFELMLTGRTVSSTGGHVVAGIGTSPSMGAGAPGFRFVLGGGFGSVDREVSRARLVVGAIMDGTPVDARIVATGPDGQQIEGTGELVLEGVVGGNWRVQIEGDCLGGTADLLIPEGGGATRIPAVPSEDPTCGRTLVVEPADAMVWMEHPVCTWVPVSEAAEFLGTLPPGTQVQLSAPGYLPTSAGLGDGAVSLKPAPEQGGLVILAGPGDTVTVGEQALPHSPDGVFLVNLAEGFHPVRVEGAGRLFEDEAATVSGFAVWVRVPDPTPRELYFASGRATLDTRAVALLQPLSEHPGHWKYEVRGSFSADGAREANVELASRRAEAVKAWLLDNGIAEEHIRVAEPLEPVVGVDPATQRRVTVTAIGGVR